MHTTRKYVSHSYDKGALPHTYKTITTQFKHATVINACL